MCESSSNIGAFSMTDTDLHMDLGMNELAQSPPQQQEDAGCREEIDQLAQLQQEDNVIIRDGMKVLIKMPMRPIKLVTVESGKDIDLGKFGQVAADSLIGMPFDIQYEILGKDKIRQISDPEVIEIENEEANNRDICDDPDNQLLSMLDIEQMKEEFQSHEDGTESMINKIIENNKDFELKNQFSKQKYLKRKLEKYRRQFKILRPGIVNICEYFLERSGPTRLQISSDALGFMLHMAGAGVGGRYLCIDDTGGILLGALLERMGLQGSVTCIHKTEHPAIGALGVWNLHKSVNELVEDGTVNFLNWLAALEPQSALEDAREIVQNSERKLYEKGKSRQSQERAARRRKSYESLKRRIDDLELGDFHALIVASDLDIEAALPRLTQLLSGSMPVVIFNEAKEQLIPLHNYMQKLEADVLAPTIHEIRHREYQTMLGQLHPLMSARGENSFVLTGYRVFRDSTVIAAGGAKCKRRRK